MYAQPTNSARKIKFALRLADGTPATTIAHNTGGLSVAAIRDDQANPVPIALVALTGPNMAFTAGAFGRVGAANLYHLHVPASVRAPGVEDVVIEITGAGLEPCHVRIALPQYDPLLPGAEPVSLATELASNDAYRTALAEATAVRLRREGPWEELGYTGPFLEFTAREFDDDGTTLVGTRVVRMAGADGTGRCVKFGPLVPATP